MFNNIIGNNECKAILRNLIINNNISHSYIFSGPSGVGKFLFAKEFAKSILCTNQNLEKRPCDECKSCESMDDNNNPDLLIIDEENGSIRNEQIKKIVSDVFEKPILSSKKVYIINNSENMTREAQNSLLKTLEEPPEHTIIILISNNENLLLNTIKSRCFKINFNSLTDNELMQYFKESNIDIDEQFLQIFEGSIEKALVIMQNVDLYTTVTSLFKDLNEKNELEVLQVKDIIFNDKENIFTILNLIDVILYNKSKEDIDSINKYKKCIDIIEMTKQRLKRNSNYDMTLDNFLLAIWEVFR